ncbi:MAG: M20/M25/M40 family metallo-hydrolase [Candidatus Thermoplasmatota archaeon]
MDQRKKILTRDEEEELIYLTKELIKIPSSVKDGDEVYHFTHQYLKEKGFDVSFQTVSNPYIDYYEFSNLYLKVGNGNGPKIMLNGHLDTVSVEDEQQWVHPPFEGVEEKGRIYGRGAADMKAGCAAEIIALLGLVERKEEINGELFLSCVFGEEAPFSLGADTLLREFPLDDYSLIVVAEPSPLLAIDDYCFTHERIHEGKFPVTIIGAEGRVLLEIEFFGRAAHASHPSIGVNVLHDASNLISELARFDIFTHIKRGRGHYVVLNIDGGDYSFTVPSFCKVLVNRQVMLGESTESVIREVKKIVNALNLKSKVNIYRRHSPGPELEYKPFLNEEDEYIDLFMDKVNDMRPKEDDVEGEKKTHCKFSTKSVGDFNLFGTRTDAPTIIFGPGGGNIHAPDEFVNKDEVIDTANYLLNYLMEVF